MSNGISGIVWLDETWMATGAERGRIGDNCHRMLHSMGLLSTAAHGAAVPGAEGKKRLLGDDWIDEAGWH